MTQQKYHELEESLKTAELQYKLLKEKSTQEAEIAETKMYLTLTCKITLISDIFKT